MEDFEARLGQKKANSLLRGGCGVIIKEKVHKQKNTRGVKMAEETAKRVTGWKPMYPNMPDMSVLTVPFSGRTDEVSDATVPKRDGTSHFLEPQSQDKTMSPGLSELSPNPPQVDNAHGTATGGKMGTSASIPRVASLEHLQKRIRGEPGSC
ncbi:hypothetical protein Taro_019614 [Colocasia esculenta]|uniref:Basic leucine-zipper C-terminal domain-containing protein n=1 Tax=Colocasia esculenta TaxID=4460 RepID=A0A843UU86_COLES|nr:hypothetical protein [Colocasia esculenta]